MRHVNENIFSPTLIGFDDSVSLLVKPFDNLPSSGGGRWHRAIYGSPATRSSKRRKCQVHAGDQNSLTLAVYVYLVRHIIRRRIIYEYKV